MADLLRECNAGELQTDPKTFRDTWCVRCSRPECNLAGFAKSDPMAARNATWRERFFSTPGADLRLPKYAQIARLDFPNLLQKAMKLEVSERRGDWSVPEIPVLDGVIQRAPPDTTSQVDDARRKLLAGKGVLLDPQPPEAEEDEEDEEEVIADDEEAEEPAPEPKVPLPPVGKVLPQPVGRNTPDPGEVMLGGGPVPPSGRPRPAPEADPWAPPPKPSVTIVKSGAKIQFGVGGQAKVVPDDQ